VLLGGCRKYAKQPVFVDDRSLTKITTPEAPKNDSEKLIAAALTRAVIDERDIPMYYTLEDEESIVVVNAIGMDRYFNAGEYFTAGALPHSEDVKFTLLTPKQIKQRIIHKRKYLFIHVKELKILEKIGIIRIAIQKASDQWDLERGWIGCYELEYERIGDEWRFSEIADSFSFFAN
jgi:hypothetical protein